jgi:uncharacterized protein YndB with AHSA1/START domain
MDLDGAASVGGHELVLTRALAAVPARVFEAWIRPVHAMRWWGCLGHTATVCSMDLRPGGAWRACLRSPTGACRWMRGIFREIRPPRRLSFTLAWIEEDGLGPEMLVTVDLFASGAGTGLTLRQAPFATAELCQSQRDDWNERFDRLQGFLNHE